MDEDSQIIRLKDKEFHRRAGQIRLLLLDVDGVLTDGRIIIDAEGREIKAFHVRDGLGIRFWLRAGFEAAVITGRSSEAVAHRCQDLGIPHVTQGATDKVPPFLDLLGRLELEPSQVCVMGDDLPDLPLMLASGLGATVADAHTEIYDQADLVTEARGGHGAVREVIELLLESKGLWAESLQHYSRTIT